MKNSLNISVAGEDLISTVDDSTNRLFINGTEVPSTSWTGSGTYSTTVNGHAITITQVDDATGNVAIRRTAAYTYELYKIRSGDQTVNGDLTVTGSISEGGVPLDQKYAPITGAGKIEELWSQAATSAFSAGSVIMDKSAADYDFCIVMARYTYWQGSYKSTVVIPNGWAQSIMATQEGNGATVTYRDCTISGKTATFGNGWYTAGGSSGNGSSYCIPAKIYGVKL